MEVETVLFCCTYLRWVSIVTEWHWTGDVGSAQPVSQPPLRGAYREGIEGKELEYEEEIHEA